MRIKLSQSDWREIGAKMGWLKKAQDDMGKSAAAFQGSAGYDKVTAEDFNRAAQMAKDKAIAASRSLDGIQGMDAMRAHSEEGFPTFTACSTPDEREECWYDFSNYCDHLDGFLEYMRERSGGIPRREHIAPLGVLNEAMKTRPAPSEASEMSAERNASDRIG